MNKNLKIGLFGFGCVGQGLYDVLLTNPGFKSEIVKIAIKDPNKKRNLDNNNFTTNKYDILNNKDIDIIVELIDDYEEAYQIVKYALQQKKHVVTANKKMLAYYLPELQALQKEHNVALLYEASSCGSIPVIRQLEEYYDNDNLSLVEGIFNGTTNYILTKTINEGLSYKQALQLAQESGFAESDPTNDVEGFDAKYKAIIIALHAFGIYANVDEVLNIGITTLSDVDIQYATEKLLSIKLVPTIIALENNEIGLYVLPKFISINNPLYNVANEFNGICLQTQFSGLQFLSGKGAGGLPTGSAVLSDISALQYGYTYEYKKQLQQNTNKVHNNFNIKVYYRYEGKVSLNLNIIKIIEQYHNDVYGYIIGEIAVSELLINRDEILSKNSIIISFE